MRWMDGSGKRWSATIMVYAEPKKKKENGTKRQEAEKKEGERRKREKHSQRSILVVSAPDWLRLPIALESIDCFSSSLPGADATSWATAPSTSEVDTKGGEATSLIRLVSWADGESIALDDGWGRLGESILF